MSVAGASATAAGLSASLVLLFDALLKTHDGDRYNPCVALIHTVLVYAPNKKICGSPCGSFSRQQGVVKISENARKEKRWQSVCVIDFSTREHL